jgi:hypothetical protein
MLRRNELSELVGKRVDINIPMNRVADGSRNNRPRQRRRVVRERLKTRRNSRDRRMVASSRKACGRNQCTVNRCDSTGKAVTREQP